MLRAGSELALERALSQIGAAYPQVESADPPGPFEAEAGGDASRPLPCERGG